MRAARPRCSVPVLTVHHRTTYRYRRPVGFGEHRMMVRPRDSHDQQQVGASLEITPTPAVLRWSQDVFGNNVATARFSGRAKELTFLSTLQVDHQPQDAEGIEAAMDDHARSYPFSYDSGDMPDLMRLVERQYQDPSRALEDWVRSHLHADGAAGTLGILAAMTHRIRQQFTYRARHEPGIQPPATTLHLGTGTCRDFAVLMMEAARCLGLATRFVSGYIYVPSRDRPGAEHRGGGNTHAWLQVYLPGAGWVEFDPTNAIVGTRDLIRVATVRDPRQAVPLSGSWMGAAGDCLGMEVAIRVTSEDTQRARPAMLA
jgi:transglutaminase-like putative cysteine protease